MFCIGITGGFGTGKTTVAMMFARLGAKVLDADRITHRLISPRGACFRPIIKQFGRQILTRGRIDRKRLADIVFEHPQRRRKLESIIHPQVGKTIRARLKGYRRSKRYKAVVLDVPLLLEANLHRAVDVVVVVKANRQQQLERLKRRMKLSDREILKRIKAQMPMRKKLKLADFTIDNRNGKGHTRKQVVQLWHQLFK